MPLLLALLSSLAFASWCSRTASQGSHISHVLLPFLFLFFFLFTFSSSATDDVLSYYTLVSTFSVPPSYRSTFYPLTPCPSCLVAWLESSVCVGWCAQSSARMAGWRPSHQSIGIRCGPPVALRRRSSSQGIAVTATVTATATATAARTLSRQPLRPYPRCMYSPYTGLPHDTALFLRHVEALLCAFRVSLSLSSLFFLFLSLPRDCNDTIERCLDCTLPRYWSSAAEKW